jgi:homoserine kinase
MRLTARVPATSANLGPGFDCFGLALDLCNEVTIDTGAEPGVSWEGEGAGELPTDGTDLVSRAIRSVSMSLANAVPPAVAVRGRNAIPLERGLGSSAAAVVAGVVLANRLLDGPGDLEMLFDRAVAIEGHPDNVAAAVFGGFTVAYGDGVARLDPSPELRPVVLIPEARLATDEARRDLSPTIERGWGVFNLQRSALAVVALTQRPDLLRDALQDRLHQDARLARVPVARALFERLRDEGIPVCVSGSGPSLLAFEGEHHPVPDPGDGWRVLRVPVRLTGVEVVED